MTDICKLKAITDDKMIGADKLKLGSRRVENIVGKEGDAAQYFQSASFSGSLNPLPDNKF